MNSNYALHEMLEVHEIAAFKTVCLTKSKNYASSGNRPGALTNFAARCAIITAAASGARWSSV